MKASCRLEATNASSQLHKSSSHPSGVAPGDAGAAPIGASVPGMTRTGLNVPVATWYAIHDWLLLVFGSAGLPALTWAQFTTCTARDDGVTTMLTVTASPEGIARNSQRTVRAGLEEIS